MSHELRQGHEHDNNSSQDEKQQASSAATKANLEAAKSNNERDAAWADFPRESAFDRH